MVEVKLIRFWPVFREVFWAAVKSLVIIVLFAGFLISSAIVMVHLEDMPTNGVFFEIIGTGVLLALAGLLLWLPFVFALVLTVGTPVALFLLNKGYVSELLWMAIGAFFTGVIAAGVSHFSEFPDYFLLGGTLTGYFACRQTANFREPKA